MDALDRKLREIETEIWEILPSIDHPRLKLLLADRASVRRTKELVGSLNGNGASAPEDSLLLTYSVTPDRYPRQDGMTRGDAMVEILRKAPEGLHVKYIVKELESFNFKVSTHSAVGIMKNDTQKRFKHLGHSYYDLADFIRSGNEHSYSPRPAFKRIRGLGGLTLKAAIVQVIEGLEGEFGQPDVYQLLIKKFPEAKPYILKETIAVTLNTLRKQALIVGTYEGNGRYPKLYVRPESASAQALLSAARDGYGRAIAENLAANNNDLAANNNELAEAV